jgi:hypothetical protein
MSQKYPSNKAPYESQVVAASLWLCCVDKNGRRKKAYTTRKEASASASKLHGKVYHCLFNSDILHVTTQTKSKPQEGNPLVTEHQIKGLKERLEKTKTLMEELREQVQQMNGDTPIEEIKAASNRWNELCDKKKNLQRSLKNKKTTLRRLLKV